MSILVHSLSLGAVVFVGHLSVRYEYFDHDDGEVMLVIGDPSQPRLKRLHPVNILPGTGVPHSLTNGATLTLEAGATQKRVFLRIKTDLPITWPERVDHAVIQPIH